jgi:hypothetical protein
VIETWVKTKDILLNLLDLYFLRKKTRMWHKHCVMLTSGRYMYARTGCLLSWHVYSAIGKRRHASMHGLN